MPIGIPALLGPELLTTLCAKGAPGRKVVALAGADFYLWVRFAHAIVATSEQWLCVNIIIRKGVIYPPENRKS